MTRSVHEDVIEHLKSLKLSTIRMTLDDHLRLGQSKTLTYLEFLHGLTSEEIKGREESNYRRRLKAAKFPVKKTLEEFDFAFQSSLSKERVWQLKDCQWVTAAHNLILAGESGTGKTHLAIALGLEAIKRGHKVYFTSVADLLDQINIATISGQTLNLQNKLLKHAVIVLDELGYLKVNRNQGNFLFRLISKAYENLSLIITTNKDFSGWAEIFEDQAQVTAMLDRILHHCVMLNVKGESYRIKNQKDCTAGGKS
jgi:DNA replication protein DnaC